jgi:hypothetical protein
VGVGGRLLRTHGKTHRAHVHRGGTRVSYSKRAARNLPPHATPRRAPRHTHTRARAHSRRWPARTPHTTHTPRTPTSFAHCMMTQCGQQHTSAQSMIRSPFFRWRRCVQAAQCVQCAELRGGEAGGRRDACGQNSLV